MKLLDRLISSTKAFKAVKRTAEQNALTLFRANNQAGVKPQAEALIGISYACMNKRANEVARSETLVGYWDSEDNFIKEPNHWLSELLYMPNIKTKMTWHDIKYLVSMWLDYTGNAYLWTPLYNGSIKQPIDIWVLPSSLVEIIPGTQGSLIDGYKLKSGSNVLQLPVEEVCHIRTFSPSGSLADSLYKGKPGIIDSIRSAVNNDSELMGFIEKYFDRQAFPPLFYKAPDGMTDEQWNRIKREWNLRLPDTALAGILEGGADVKAIEIGMKDMQSALFRGSVSEELYNRITQAFEVPKSILEMEYKDTRSINGVLHHFKSSVIDSILKRIESQLTMHFRQWDETIAIIHEPYVYQENLLQVNHPDTGELLTFVPSGWTLIQTAAIAGSPAPKQETPNGEQPKSYKATELSIKDDMTAIWKANDDLNQDGAKRLEKGIANCFEELKDHIVKNLPKNIKSISGIHAKREIVADLFNIEQWRDKIKDNTKDDLADYMDQVFERALKEIGQNWDKIRTDFEDEMAKALRGSSDKIAESINTIHSELKDTIQSIIDDNPTDTADELLDKLKEATADKFSKVYTEARARMIAQTTSTYALGEGQAKSWKKFGFDMQWLSQRDKAVRQSHMDADGQKRTDGYFDINGDKMEHPGAGSKAEENVNCRCSMFPVKGKTAYINGNKHII